ncbi:ferric reductase like transmembrane component [Microdochium trichocladiopsis]|uniref:Ferric reductase like transmembrane component n=1 Tax=Microdochium trichocladiopsis TaxID=1682393 RepID=A0A9P8YEE5_9PEZI|nr:ferric reductase like transmembrane component [Microdochium trichocladiopsis]KAH7037476.1 ferric reductase like transmembrane component [Microdochium trichocladiopsis]
MADLSTTPTAIERRAHPAAKNDPMATDAIGQYSTLLNGVNQDNNMLFSDSLWWTLGIMAMIVLAIRILESMWHQLRQVSAMPTPGKRQTYWKTAQWSWMPSLKKNLIYAPLWKKRHNREIQLSSAISIGTLPSRLHFIILSIYLLSNVGYMFVLNWSGGLEFARAAEVRGRSGTLAVVNMVPLIILAGRNNPLIPLLRVSFDTYNLLHRWMGRVVVVETVVHTCAWLYVAVAAQNWEQAGARLFDDIFLASGLYGTIALFVLLVLSLSPLRHAFYETFLNVHILLAMFILAMTLVHCSTAHVPGGHLPQLPFMVAIFSIWFADRLARMFRLTYNNWSTRGFSSALVEALPGDASRVTIELARHIEVKPGTHAYLRFSGVRAWESHPFSIAWVAHHPASSRAKVDDGPPTAEDIQRGTTSVSFIIGAHTGFTRQLHNTAMAGPGQTIRLKAAMEGPYAGHHQLGSYGHAVLFAGATGITHQLSYLKPLIEGHNDGVVATRRITLVWVMRDTEALQWIRPWMDEVLRLPNRREILSIKLFITRPKNAKEINSPSSTVQMFPGRPNISTLVKKEVEEQMGAMCVSVCGPGALADDVRQAVREVQVDRTVVDFVEESFTW